MPDVEYEWSVSLMIDPDNRSKDVFARGLIMHVESEANTEQLVSATSPSRRHFALASEGLWYDAVAAISDLVDQNPQQKTYREQRASLLEQVGLSDVADSERLLSN